MFRNQLFRNLFCMLLLGWLTASNASGAEQERAASGDPSTILENAKAEHSSSSAITVEEMNGYLFRMPGSPNIYLVMDGKRRRIAGTDLLDRLFLSTCTIWENPYSAIIEEGLPLADAYLVKGLPSSAISMFVDGKIRYIASMAIVSKYCFDTSKALAVPDSLLIYVPKGPPLT